MQFYTGIDNYVIFRDVFASLGPATTRLNYMYGVPNLDPEDKCFLTLMKLRTYKTNFELSMHSWYQNVVYTTYLLHGFVSCLCSGKNWISGQKRKLFTFLYLQTLKENFPRHESFWWDWMPHKETKGAWCTADNLFYIQKQEHHKGVSRCDTWWFSVVCIKCICWVYHRSPNC